KMIITTILVWLSVVCKSQETKIDLSSQWKFSTGDSLQWAEPAYIDSHWLTLKPAIKWNQQNVSYSGFAWYRYKVTISRGILNSSALKDTLAIRLGKIDDYDQVFLNGKFIGENGTTTSYPSMTFNHGSTCRNVPREYKLAANDPRINWDRKNVIAIRVFGNHGGGGLYSDPFFIKAADLTRYVSIDYQSSDFDFNSPTSVSKTMKLLNSSRIVSYNGQWTYQVVNEETGQTVVSKSTSLNLLPNASLPVTCSFSVNPDSVYVLKYSFVENQTGTAVSAKQEVPYILSPEPGLAPQINYPRLYGARPNSPFLFTIPASGEKPMRYSAKGLPQGLVLDATRGIISGKAGKAGVYKVKFDVTNRHGHSSETIVFKIGDTLALTPPMGWNTYYPWRIAIKEKHITDAAEAFMSKALPSHGYSYINLDEGWEGTRDNDGILQPNKNFPDMKKLADFVHNCGLKIGIYSSPGPLCCGGNVGSYQYEEIDPKTWADWGIDYLKYDLCSYESKVMKDHSLTETQKPFLVMHEALKKVNRDIVYSLCQYGLNDVWKWGPAVGGNLWRTTRDINDVWEMVCRIGFEQQAQLYPFAKRGHWNDPDMLVVGWNGGVKKLRPSRLTPSEQYTYISLWSLLSAPLIVGGDVTRLNDFTTRLLTNDEVISIDQDTLGIQARRIIKNGTIQIWQKPLSNGSWAVGIFNLGETFSVTKVNWSDLQLPENLKVFDVWRKKPLGSFFENFTAKIPSHGVILLKVYSN
ncbi:MAG: putative Ig domain-containing protein, partial [Bacteroidota bacterium]|nr:putative Ig domain-containing protein [Bacteroidota bacterium]